MQFSGPCIKVASRTLMKKILIGFDTQHYSMRAIEYVGHQFSELNNVEVTIIHVLPNVPASFWDDGHILSEKEIAVRHSLIESWASRQRQALEGQVDLAVNALTRSGFAREQIKTKYITGSNDVADSILDEAKEGHYMTVVLGRRGAAEGNHLLLGSVANKVIHKAENIAVCVVE